MQYRTPLHVLEERYETLGTEIERIERQLGALGGAQLEMREERARIAEQIEARRPPPLPLLAQLRVASPCSASWEKMSGDEKVRFCGDCKKHVYNVTEMTRHEAEALLEAKNGDLCVRFYERADGTVLTQDCPVGVRKKERRKIALAVIGGTAMWGAGLAAAAGAVASMFPKGEELPIQPMTQLTQQADPGTLKVNGEAGTRVTVDGEIAATLPAALFSLAPGTHRVRLDRADGNGPEEHVVTIASNATTFLTQKPYITPAPVPTGGRWLAGAPVRPRTPLPADRF